MRRTGPMVVCLALAALAVACGSFQTAGPTYSATAIVKINPANPPGEARRAALGAAEYEARQQLITQAYQLRLSDGRTLDQLAVVDPFVRAVVEDTVRRARITDRTINDEGVITLTLGMDLAPLYHLVANYNKHPI